jgi:hypothetical protein
MEWGKGGCVGAAGGFVGKNKKGCDFGYAPAANSCEGANNPDTCTVTALDVISAFAEPDPGYPSQGSPDFSGPAAHRVAPVRGSPSLLRIGESFQLPTLSAVDNVKIRRASKWVNARYWCSEVENRVFLLKTRRVAARFTAETQRTPSSPSLAVFVSISAAKGYERRDAAPSGK